MKIFENNQEVFDAAWHHMKNQNAFSITTKRNGDSKCSYFDKKTGNMCAIGGILPAGFDKAGLNGYSDSSITGLLLNTRSKFTIPVRHVFQKIDRLFLDEIQCAHDGNATNSTNGIGNFFAEMKRIALEWNLKAPE